MHTTKDLHGETPFGCFISEANNKLLVTPVVLDECREAGAQQPMQKRGTWHWKEQQRNVQGCRPGKGT